MQGASPLASPGLNPDGTGQGSAPRTRRGAGFSGCRIDLAAVVPKGGLGGWGCRLTLPLALFLAPIPPTPFPAGRGDFLFSYARGSAPCIPGAEPGRHGLNLRRRSPAGKGILVFLCKGLPPPAPLLLNPGGTG